MTGLGRAVRSVGRPAGRSGGQREQTNEREAKKRAELREAASIIARLLRGRNSPATVIINMKAMI